MTRKDDTSSSKAVWIGGICVVVVAAAIGLAFWLNKKTEPPPETGIREPEKVIARKGPEKVRQPMPKPPAEKAVIPETPDATPDQTAPSPVVDYDKIKDDRKLRALMEKRKEKYGFEKGVDLIVKPDESVKVGDEVVPMNEILDRIRLQEGEVLEKDISGSPVTELPAPKSKNMVAELDALKQRHEQLDQLIRDTDPAEDKGKKETYTQEREALGKIVTVYEDYRDTVKKIEEKKELLESLTRQASEAAAPAPADQPAPSAPAPAGRIASKTPKPVEQPAPAERVASSNPEPNRKSEPAAPTSAERVASSSSSPVQKIAPSTSVPEKRVAPPTPKFSQQPVASTQKPIPETDPLRSASAERTGSRPPEPIQEKTIPEKQIPAVGAGTGHRSAVSQPGEKSEAGPHRQSAPTSPSEIVSSKIPDNDAPEREMEKSMASSGTPTVQRPKKETGVKRSEPVLPALKPVAPGPSILSPKPSVRKSKRRVAIATLKKEIEEEINMLLLQKGDLENELLTLLKKEKRPEAYGIYIVQRRDNIWNIHYKFLKEYFGHRDINLSGDADEPDRKGRSSGVGKVLKFSEKMVYIYNLRERKLATDINLIHPLSKIVVFNMTKVLDLLKDVDYRDMNEIQFDGENIWLPARS